MKLSPAAIAVSAAFVWGAAIFVIGGINSLVPGYGEPVLALVVSLYPGYDANGGFGDLLVGTAYAVFDGLAAGFVFALLYNTVAGLGTRGADDTEPTAAG
jgi:ABC-type phosphate transport system permease subunit